MKTLVIGASHNPARYSHMAVKMLKEYEHEVVALGRKAKPVEDWEILDGKPEIPNLDTITVYLNADNQINIQELFVLFEFRILKSFLEPANKDVV